MHQVIELSMDISNNDDRFFNSNKVRFLLYSHEISIFFIFLNLLRSAVTSTRIRIKHSFVM